MNVHPKEGGPWSLFCEDCKTWTPNTADATTKKEGGFAHSHVCGHLTPEEIPDDTWQKQHWHALEEQVLVTQEDTEKSNATTPPVVPTLHFPESILHEPDEDDTFEQNASTLETKPKTHLGMLEREFIFREMQHSYYMEDAERQVADYVEAEGIDIDDVDYLFDYDELATTFARNHDCNVADNDQWQSIIAQYLKDRDINLKTVIKEYTVTFSVTGKFVTTVPAISEEHAKERAKFYLQEADFGDLKEVDENPYFVEVKEIDDTN